MNAPTPLPLPQRMDILEALRTRPKPPNFVLPGLPTGAVGSLIAPGATGKTLFLLQVCISLATGTPILGGGLFADEDEAPQSPCRVVLVVAEETFSVMHARLHATFAELMTRVQPDLLNQAGIALPSLLAENLLLFPLAGRARMLVDGSDTETHGMAALSEMSAGARLVVLDPLRRFHSGEENDPWTMTRLVQDLEMLACRNDGAVLLAHHANKWSTVSGQGDRAGAARGSAAFTDAVRWQMNLSALDDDLARKHGIADEHMRFHIRADLAKANYMPPQEPTLLRRGPGGAFSVLASPKQRLPTPPTRKARK